MQSSKINKPIALTIGDPSGIGPEITVAAWRELAGDIPFFVIGDPGCFAGVEVREITDVLQVAEDALCVMPEPFAVPPVAGAWQPENAAGTIRSIEKAVALAQSGDVSAVVTSPITKKILVDGADFAHPGHTEFLAALDNKDHSVMMLASPELRVVPVTIHIPLDQVAEVLTPELLEGTILVTERALREDFGIAAPRIAVAGLNPHAGEGGMLGRQELAFIGPILDRLRARGMDISQPMSADTMFHARARAGYDVAICMYHDQALIPIKTIDFDRGVNATLGLSFIRTSPDHGTAYDIAGKGLANPSSLIEAIRLADQMAQNRARL